MKFSLVLATVGRTTELSLLLDSLVKQVGVSLELIVVDQNPDNRLLPILEPYQELFPIIYLRSEKGLSKARNVGLKHVTGNIVAFPDDDCEYPADCLSYIEDKFASNQNLGGLTGRSVTHEGLSSIGKFSTTPGEVTKASVWLQGISFTIFLRAEVVRGLVFDETLGVGAKWGSGEETDFLLQALKKGATIVYDPTLKIVHPPPPAIYTPELTHKEFSYGLGMGKVLKNHGYPLSFKANLLLRPIGGMFVSLAKLDLPKAKGYWYRFLGRWQGLIAK